MVEVGVRATFMSRCCASILLAAISALARVGARVSVSVSVRVRVRVRVHEGEGEYEG